jgi:hypothetical protein
MSCRARRASRRRTSRTVDPGTGHKEPRFGGVFCGQSSCTRPLRGRTCTRTARLVGRSSGGRATDRFTKAVHPSPRRCADVAHRRCPPRPAGREGWGVVNPPAGREGQGGCVGVVLGSSAEPPQARPTQRSASAARVAPRVHVRSAQRIAYTRGERITCGRSSPARTPSS